MRLSQQEAPGSSMAYRNGASVVVRNNGMEIHTPEPWQKI